MSKQFIVGDVAHELANTRRMRRERVPVPGFYGPSADDEVG
ncbi:hypothetical protein [Paenibacillus chitinolyticus]